jgi:hypothetical protein
VHSIIFSLKPEINSKSYALTEGTLGLQTHPYTLKKYNDGTFDLVGRMDVSNLSFSYSGSTNLYYFPHSVPVPEELSIDREKPYVFTGAVESNGIYGFSPRSIDANNINAYISANRDPGTVNYLTVYFEITGFYN